MPAVIRIGDPITCGDTMGQGSGNVITNGIPTSRLGIDKTAGHCFPPVPIISASPNVYVNNIKVDRVGDPIPVHCCGKSCHSGRAAAGSPNVFANESSTNAGYVRNDGYFVPPPPPEPPVQLTPTQFSGYQSNQAAATSYNTPENRNPVDPINGSIATGVEVGPDPAVTPEVVKNCSEGSPPERNETDTQIPDIVSLLTTYLGEAKSGAWLEGTVYGRPSNPNIMAVFRDVGHTWPQDDSVYWCAGFAGAVLKRACYKFQKSLRARDYLSYGNPVASLAEAKQGDIIVFGRDGPPGSGHVAFVWEKPNSTIVKVVGGNQSNNVTLCNFKTSGILGIRRPVR